MKLNLGCGEHLLQEGFINIDIDIPQCLFLPWKPAAPNFRQWDLTKGIPCEANTVEYINCHHFLEHLTYLDGRGLVAECLRVLEPGGVLSIVVPDFAAVAARYEVNPKELEYMASLILYPLGYGQTHASTYDTHLLKEICLQAGFHSAERQHLYDVPHMVSYIDWQTAVKCVKQAPPPLYTTGGNVVE